MTTQNSLEELSWWNYAEPTSEELYLSGGLQVEDWPHARQVTRLSTQLFEATLPLHALDVRALRLLERAALLHNTGMMVESRRHHKHSFRLINETKLPDFTDEERALPSREHKEFAALGRTARRRVSALAALLRIADALDFNHDGRVLRLAVEPGLCNEQTWTILLWARPLADLDVELEHAYEKADLFEKTFKRKIRLIIRQS